MITCPNCQRSSEQVKAGFTSAGSQRYLCKVCRRKYTPETKPLGYEQTVRTRAIHLYLDGYSQRHIARQIGVSQGSISNWVRPFANSRPDEEPPSGHKVEGA